MYSDYTAQGTLNHITGVTAMFSLPSPFLALFTTAPTSDSGAGAVEVTGGSYARAAASGSSIWNSASGSGPSTIVTKAQIAFTPASGNWGTAVAWGLFDSLSSGNLLYWDWLGNFTWQPVTISSSSPTIFTIGQSAYGSGSSVVLDVSNRFGGISPTYSAGSPSNNTVLTVLSPSGLTFQLQNGSTTIGTSAAGSSLIRQVLQQAIPSGVQAIFVAGALTLGSA